ncbi:Uncharacterised protein [Vibrio cholerae]|nr:Uncharacterised protein [Vibrio cholerae]CSC54366.1 Uncharacterised protein [Vibrio cholerae]
MITIYPYSSSFNVFCHTMSNIYITCPHTGT